MTYNYCEIVKEVFLHAGEGQNIYDYKIEIYKKKDGFFYSRLFKNEIFDLQLCGDNIITSETIYVDGNDKLSLGILEEKSFTCIDECLNFALEKLEEDAKNQREYYQKRNEELMKFKK